MASFWQTRAMVRPLARSASASRSLWMTCSGVCRFRMSRLLGPVGRQRLSYHLDHFSGSRSLWVEVSGQPMEPAHIGPKPGQGRGALHHPPGAGNSRQLPSFVLLCLHLKTEDPVWVG